MSSAAAAVAGPQGGHLSLALLVLWVGSCGVERGESLATSPQCGHGERTEKSVGSQLSEHLSRHFVREL